MQSVYTIVALFIMLISSIAVLCNHSKNEGEKLVKMHCAISYVFPNSSLLEKNLWAKGVLPQLAELMSVNAYYNHNTTNGVSPYYRKKQAESFIYWKNKVANAYKRCCFPEANDGRWWTMDARDMNGNTNIILGYASI